MKKIFKLLLASIGVATASIGSYLGLSKFTYNKIFKDEEEELTYDDLADFVSENDKENYLKFHTKNKDWFSNSKVEKVSIKSFDGHILNGELILNNPNSDFYAIVVHGYRADSHTLLQPSRFFDSNGFNVLLYDQRGHGLSNSTNTTLGWQEQFDLIKWIDFIINRNSKAKILLYGVSMGGFSILMALGSDIVKNVKCAIVEGAYCNLKDVIKHSLKNVNPLSEMIIPGVNYFVEEELGFNIKDVDALKVIKNAKIPLLILHSIDDEVVPYKCAVDIYENYGCLEKEIYDMSNVKHATGFYHKNYFEVISKFVFKYFDNSL